MNAKRIFKHTSVVGAESKLVALRDVRLDRKIKSLTVFELKSLGDEYDQERRGCVKQKINFHDL